MKFYRINALLLKYWYLTINSLDRIFDVFYWPLIGLVIFGFTTLYIEKASNFPDIFIFLIGGSILWNIFERVQQDVASYVLEDFWSRNIANTFVTPIKESEIFVSISLFGLFRAIISFLAMFILAFFAYQFNIFKGGLFSLVFIIPLFLFAWGVGFLISGIIFKFGTRIQVIAWSISFLMQPLAVVYYPLATLPLILQKIAYIMPLAHVFEGFRMAYNGVFSFYHLFWAFELSVVYMILGYVIFVACIKGSKESGLLTKY